jgi:hypothetical protein
MPPNGLVAVPLPPRGALAWSLGEDSVKRAITTLAAILLLTTACAGTASADPGSGRTIDLSCDGELLTVAPSSGTAALVVGDSRVLVLKGLTEDGVWLQPISNGQSKADLVACVYVHLVDGHQRVAWVRVSGPGSQ